jgi:hypothetical protein
LNPCVCAEGTVKWKDDLDDLKKEVSSYLAGDSAHRLRLMANHLEVFEITDPMHPAKRRTEDVLRWMEIRPIERGLRARKVSCHLSWLPKG